MPTSAGPVPTELMTSAEVASALYVSQKTVDNWRRAGHFRDHVITYPGNRYRFHAEYVRDVAAGRAELVARGTSSARSLQLAG